MNKYQQTITDIFDLHLFSIKMGLDNITTLSQSIGNPHLSYPTIHIAGTNGKGSTAAILQQILFQHGLKVGLFTSPHLVKFNERIRVNNDLIEDEYIENYWQQNKDLVLDLKATFFDTTTCLAFDYFRHKQVEVAIIETGLGGRLDSTNIIQPVASVITPIGFDHQKQLGNTLTSIAREKAGIIKKGAALFLGHQKEEALNFFYNQKFDNNILIDQERSISYSEIVSNLDNTTFSFTDLIRNQEINHLQLNLLGIHQAQNATLAYLVGRWYLEQISVNFELGSLRNAFKSVIWNGRIQKISCSPDIYLDVSHNADGFRPTIKFLSDNFKKENSHLLIGLLADKNYDEIVSLVKDQFKNIVVTEPENEHKLEGSILINELKKYGINVKFIKEVKKAFEISINNLGPDDTLFVMGSHYLAGSVLNSLKEINLT